jgi:hypothetical protein
VARRKPPSLINLPTFESDGTDFGEWIETMKPEHMGCRDFGHVWRALTASFDKEHNSFTRTQKCQRCKANRTQTLSNEGLMGGTSYTYPDGYKAPEGSGRWDRDARAALRLVATLRMIEK